MIYITHNGVSIPIDTLIEKELDEQFYFRAQLEEKPNNIIKQLLVNNTERVQKLYSLKDHNNGRKANFRRQFTK